MHGFLPKLFAILLTLAAFVGLPLFLMIVVLSDAIESSPQPLLVMSYIFAGYLILLVLLMLPRLGRMRRRKRKGLLYSDSYLDAAELRSEVTLVMGVAINLGYAVFKLVAAARHQSLLFAAESFYYLVLCGIRLLLAYNVYSARRRDDRSVRAWKSYRRCGLQLLLLDLSMGLVVVQSLQYTVDSVKFAAVTYGSAAWAFYRLTTALVQLIKFRGSDRPLISASKCINLSAALMSIFILQNTLLLHFGNDELFRQKMNTGFGVGIGIAVIGMALYMIVHGTKELSAIRASAALESRILKEHEEAE